MNKKIGVKDIFSSILDGFTSFRKRALLHILTTIIIPIFIGAIFLVVYYSALVLKQEAFILPISYPLFCMMIPLMMANLAVTDKIYLENISGINYIKYIASKLWNSGVIKLIFTCALLQTALYLASLYVINAELSFAKIIYETLSFIVVIFQIIIFFAIPAKISDDKDIAPFKWLYKSLIACLRNIIPVLLFTVISIITIMIIALVIPKSIYAIYLFLVLIILFMIIFGIICSKIANKII